MIHKVFSGSRYGGRNLSAKSLVKYLTRDKSSVEAMAQVGVRLLRGDIVSCLEIAESLAFKQKYFSGCLSFEEQNLPDEIKEKIMQSYEEVIFTGIEEQYRQMAWVEHTDKGRLELNFFMPCVDMATGNSFKPYYHQADQYLIKRWQTLINHDYNLTDPDDNPRPNLTPLWKFKEGKGSDNEVRNNIIEKVSKVCVSMMLQGGNREDFVNEIENANIGYQVKRNKRGELPKDYITLILSADSEEGKEYQLSKELKIKLEGDLYRSGTDTKSPDFINQLIHIAQQTREQKSERLVQTTRATAASLSPITRPTHYRAWQPNDFGNQSEADAYQKRHTELLADFNKYLEPRTARHAKRYGERHSSAVGNPSKQHTAGIKTRGSNPRTPRETNDYNSLWRNQGDIQEHSADIGHDALAERQSKPNGGDTGGKSSQNQGAQQADSPNGLQVDGLGVWGDSTPVLGGGAVVVDGLSKPTTVEFATAGDRHGSAVRRGGNESPKSERIYGLHREERPNPQGRAFHNQLPLSLQANESGSVGGRHSQHSVLLGGGGIYGLSDTDVERFNHYAQRFAQRKREAQQREQGIGRADGVVGATKRRIAKTQQRIDDDQRAMASNATRARGAVEQLATAGKQLQAGIGAVERDCDGLKQSVERHRREFVGLGNVCYVDGEGNRHPMSHKDKEDYADGTPVLELVKTTKRLKRERELENTPRFGR